MLELSHHVPMTDPGQQLTRVSRPIGRDKTADAKASDAETMYGRGPRRTPLRRVSRDRPVDESHLTPRN
jgi:hypothetical protein